MRISTVGSATIDLFFQDDDFPEIENGSRLSLAYGGKYVANQFVQSLGGGGANAAVSLARQGFGVYYWGKVGRDSIGNEIIQKLQQENVQTQLIDQSSSETTISAILLGKKRERTIITYRSQNDLLDFNDQVKNILQSSQWFYFGNLTTCSKEIKIKWLEFAKEKAVKTFVSLSGDEYKKGEKYLKDFFKLSDIFILNAHELADIWEGNAQDLDFKKNYSHLLNIPLLIVTCDVHGSYVYLAGKTFYQPIVKPKEIVDTTGAGDAYASGFLGKYLKTNDIQTSMEFAASNASSVISFISAQKGLLYDP